MYRHKASCKRQRVSFFIMCSSPNSAPVLETADINYVQQKVEGKNNKHIGIKNVHVHKKPYLDK